MNSSILWVACIAITLFGEGLLLGQEEFIQMAKHHAKGYSLEAELGLNEYRSIAEIAVEASPDSELLFNAKATMEIMQLQDVRLERFRCYPKILSDDRPRANVGKGGVLDHGPLARLENWERIALDGRVIELLEFDGSRKKAPKFSQLVHEYSLRTATFCMNPFDWPIHGPSAFNGTLKEKDIYKLTFGADRKCVYATRNEGLLETHWLKPSPQIHSVQSIVFKDDLPVKSEVYLFGKPIDQRKYDLRDAVQLIKTETTWGECGVTFVPKTIVSKIRGNPGTQQTLLLVAKISAFSTGDIAFENRKEEVVKLASSIDRTK